MPEKKFQADIFDIVARLPKEQLHEVKTERIVKSIIFTLLLLCVINFSVGQFLSTHPVNFGYWVIQEKWKLLNDLDEPVDWLILGDSSCNLGINPTVFSEKLGGSVLNLCTVGDSTALDDAWMLQRYIHRFGTPKGVVVIHAYDIWNRPLEHSMLARAPLVGDEKVDLVPAHLQTLSSRWMMMIDRNVPLYSQNVTISNSIQYAWRQSPLPSLTKLGFMPWEQASPHTVHVEYEQHISFVAAHEQFEMSEDNRSALNRIRLLADQNQFPVFFANSPIFADLMEDSNFIHYYHQVWTDLTECASNSEHLHILSDEPVTYPIDQLAGVDHVIAGAADDYTQQIAQQIDRANTIP